MSIKEILESYRNIAVYGMSKNPAKAAHSVPAFMHSKGYKVIPINPTVDSILNLKTYNNLAEVPDEIEILNVFRPSDQALDVIKEAVERRRNRGDIKLIWLQAGIFSEEGRKLANENGIEFIEDKCIYVEYNRSGVEEKK